MDDGVFRNDWDDPWDELPNWHCLSGSLVNGPSLTEELKEIEESLWESNWALPPDPVDNEPKVEEVWRMRDVCRRERRGKSGGCGDSDTRRKKLRRKGGRYLGSNNCRTMEMETIRTQCLTAVIVDGQYFRIGR